MSRPKHLRRILVVEADHELRSLYRHSLIRAGYQVVTYFDETDVHNLLASFRAPAVLATFDLVLWDVTMLDSRLIQLIEAHQQRKQFPPLIFIVSDADATALDRAGRLHEVGVFDQPWDTRSAMAQVRALVPVHAS